MTHLRNPGRLVVAAVIVAIVVACSPTESPSGATPSTPASPAATSAPATTPVGATGQPSLDRSAGWRADLAALVPGMAAIHPDLTHGVSRADLDSAVTALSAMVDTATDDQLLVGVLRIVAMVSAGGCDAHTGAYIWGSGTYPVDSLPLRLWLFENQEADRDEVVVVDALAPYQDLIGSRIDSIDGHPIADVLAAIDPIVPRDNAQTVRLLLPRFLLIPQVLRGLGLADAGPISLAVTSVAGSPSTVEVEPVAIAAYNAWAGPYGLHLPANPAIPYLSRIDDALWWAELPDDLNPGQHTLFIQNNRTDDLPASLLADLETALHDPDVSRVVLDLRHNFGGELRAIPPIEAPFDDPAVDRPGRLYVVTGRNTFSGGAILAARLDADTGAEIIGEPMGGCPTIWGDASDLILPSSGITVSVAGDTAVAVDPNDARQTIQPDVAAVLSRQDWADGIDPALRLFDIVAP